MEISQQRLQKVVSLSAGGRVHGLGLGLVLGVVVLVFFRHFLLDLDLLVFALEARVGRGGGRGVLVVVDLLLVVRGGGLGRVVGVGDLPVASHCLRVDERLVAKVAIVRPLASVA